MSLFVEITSPESIAALVGGLTFIIVSVIKLFLKYKITKIFDFKVLQTIFVSGYKIFKSLKQKKVKSTK